MSLDQAFPARSAFAAAVGTQFTLEAPGQGVVVLTLKRLMNYPPGGGDVGLPPGSESYSLFFNGPPGFVLQQSTYHVVNEAVGELALFLVPVARTAAAVEYEAVVNRLPD